MKAKTYSYSKKYLIILFSLFSLVLVNCNNKHKIKESMVENGPITVIKPSIKPTYEQIDISPILDTVKFVKLELSEKSLIGNIDKLIVFEDCIYILDSRTHSLFVYTMNGEYISKISNAGNGPGEYSQIDFFDINFEKRQIVLTDLIGYWIYKYDLEGKFISREKIPFWIEGISPAFNQGYVVYANHRDNKHKLSQEYNVFYLDSSMKVAKAYFPYNSSNLNNLGISFITPQTGSFYTYDHDRFFFSPYKDHVYEITKNGLKPKYRFDFGERTFDEKYLGHKSELKSYMEKGDFFQLANVYENNDLVIFSFHPASNPVGYFGYYSKQNNKTICSPGYTVKGNYFHSNNIATYDSWIIAVIQPADLLSWSEDVVQKKALLNSRYAKLKKDMAEKTTLEDNQVLMFYKLKRI